MPLSRSLRYYHQISLYYSITIGTVASLLSLTRSLSKSRLGYLIHYIEFCVQAASIREWDEKEMVDALDKLYRMVPAAAQDAVYEQRVNINVSL